MRGEGIPRRLANEPMRRKRRSPFHLSCTCAVVRSGWLAEAQPNNANSASFRPRPSEEKKERHFHSLLPVE